jgi:hypothetical protein
VCYQRGELLRLRGEFEAAEESYREASKHGREPQPGLALLRLAQGKAETAAAAIGHVVGATRDPMARVRTSPGSRLPQPTRPPQRRDSGSPPASSRCCA